MNLQGRRVVVTGAAGALGREVLARVTELGGVAVALDVAFAAESSGDGLERRTVDLRDAAATRRCFADIGAIDALFNIAGGFAMGAAVYETAEDDWRAMFDINVATMRNAVAAVVPGMLERGHGSIVNVGAAGAREGQANMGAYCAAKSVVMRLTESLSKELRRKGINVNAVLPGIIDTPRNRADMPRADFSAWVQARDLANVICFLGSDAARAVHGALLPVTGAG